MKITITKNCRTYKKDEVIEFPDPITILVGKNGTGKSTLLNAIRQHKEKDVWMGEHAELKDVVKLDPHRSNQVVQTRSLREINYLQPIQNMYVST